MKKKYIQLAIGSICTIVGFLMVSQFKILIKDSLNMTDKEEIMIEIDNLKNEKSELEKKNANLSEKLNKIEDTAVDKGNISKEVKESLDKTRMIIGEEDVQGHGIILSINIKSPLVVGQNADTIKEYELTHLVNLLNFSEAQAISINDYRITQQTGIRNASDFIWVGDGRVSSIKPIEIKVIGNVEKLKGGIIFPGEMEFGSLVNYDYKIEESDDVKIKKSNKPLESNYLNEYKEE